jgi:DNA-binding response OmpR family regulator
MAAKRAYRVLLVDDDVELAGSLAQQLALHGEFETVFAHSAADGMARVAELKFDVLLLDVGLPDADGRDLCRILRRRGVRTPILMLSAAASDADSILGLNSGAGDYVVKPFRFPLLLARIRAQLRQHDFSDAATFIVGGFNFRTDSRRLVSEDGKKKLMLTPKEAEILRHLCRSRGMVVPYADLLSELWGPNGTSKRLSLEMHVCHLRQKLESDQSDAPILVTEGDGYRLL